MKLNKNLRNVLYASALFTGLMIGCEYHWKQSIKDKPAPSEILPSQVDLDKITRASYPGTLPTELIFRTLDPVNHCEILFVDRGYNGSLDEVIVSNAVGKDTVTVDSPYFQEWNKKFLEYRKSRFGG